MTVLYKADLNSANNIDALKDLENECNQTKALITAIEDFISSSKTKLKGSSWDLVRTKLSAYLGVLRLRYNIASSLAGDITKANNSLLSYMGMYGELDTQYLGELDRLRAQYKNNLYNARAKYQSMMNQTADNPTVKEDTSSILGEINKYSSLIKELDDKIDKIEGLEMADISAYSTLVSAITNLVSYQSKVSAIIPSSNITSDMI